MWSSIRWLSWRLHLLPEGNEKHTHAIDLLFEQSRC
jgi:hypothetical protein